MAQSAESDARLAKIEAQVDTLTRALHLLTVAHKPTSEWLDAQMEKIDKTYIIPLETSADVPASAPEN